MNVYKIYKLLLSLFTHYEFPTQTNYHAFKIVNLSVICRSPHNEGNIKTVFTPWFHVSKPWVYHTEIVTPWQLRVSCLLTQIEFILRNINKYFISNKLSFILKDTQLSKTLVSFHQRLFFKTDIEFRSFSHYFVQKSIFCLFCLFSKDL